MPDGPRRLDQLVFALAPLALLPAAASVFVATGVLSGAGALGTLQLLRLWAHRQAQRGRELSRKISRQFSRELSQELSQHLWKTLTINRFRSFLKGALVFLVARLGYKAVAALQGFDSSLPMSKPDDKLDEKTASKFKIYLAPWGDGLPQELMKTSWRAYLFGYKSAKENLYDIHGLLGLLKRRPEEMTLDQLTEGVRRILTQRHYRLPLASKKYWSQQQARSIAESLLMDLPDIKVSSQGGLDEVVEVRLPHVLPHHTPQWLRAIQGWSIAGLRPFFHAAWSWQSRQVDTPYGKMHVLDTGSSPAAGDAQYPPMLLQHGAFVTGWSMALLGWLLSQRGRRVVIPDLFDFDYGHSVSSRATAGTARVRMMCEQLDALTYVVQYILTSSGVSEVDLVGHSLGGFIVTKLSTCCAEKGLPVRKVVLLGPGGPGTKTYADPLFSRIMNAPTETIMALKPWWLPSYLVSVASSLAFGVLFSPNNCNIVLGLDHSEYLGGSANFGTDRPTLLLWGDCDKIACPRDKEYLVPFLNSSFPLLDAFWIEGGGHNIHLDSVVAVAQAVEEWLNPEAGTPRFGLKRAILCMTNRRLHRMDLSNGAHAGLHQEAAVSRLPVSAKL